MNKLVIGLLVGGLLLSSCKRKTAIWTDGKYSLEVLNPSFEYLSCKAKFKFAHNEKRISATANFRIKMDSIIWISITPGLGLEIARVLIDQNHILFIDKLNKEYYEYKFAELTDQYGFDINFQLIQSIVLGNLFEFDANQKVKKTSSHLFYQVKKGHYTFEHFIGASSMKLEKLEVRDDTSKKAISVNYGNFVMVDQEIFPNNISAVIGYESEGEPNTKIDISYNRLIIEKFPLAFPFNTPSWYGRK